MEICVLKSGVTSETNLMGLSDVSYTLIDVCVREYRLAFNLCLWVVERIDLVLWCAPTGPLYFVRLMGSLIRKDLVRASKKNK